MKKLNGIISLIVAGAVAAAVAGCETRESHQARKAEKQARLLQEAKVSKEDAQKTALAQAPTGAIQEAELEKEHGKLIWSFDVVMPGQKDITEVNIDAINGTVVSIEKEAPEHDEKD